MAVRDFHMNTSGVLAAIGFGLTLAWCILASQSNGFMFSMLGIDEFVNPRVFYLSGILLLALAYIALPRVFRRADAALRYVLPLLAAFGTACFGLAYHQTLFESTILAVVGLFLIGIGFFWFLSRYILMLARTQTFPCAVGAIVGGLIIKLPIAPALGHIASPGLQVAVAILLPLLSALIFESACAAARREAVRAGRAGGCDLSSEARTVYGVPVKERSASPASSAFRRNTIILMVVSAILLAVVRSVSTLGLWGNAAAGEPLSLPWLAGFIVTAVLLAVFAYFALIRMADFTLTMRFQPAMLLILAGFFVVALQARPDSDALPFLTDIIQVDELFAHLLYWTVIVTALDALAMPSYRVIGISEAVFASASIAWILLLGDAAVYDNVFVLLVTYVIVIGAMYATWLGGKRRAGEETEDGGASAVVTAAGVSASDGTNVVSKKEPEPSALLTQTVIDMCLAEAKRYGLSPRETEVFVLLAQGRTRAFIQDELVLSGSTVKTHVSHIYAKMDVADRQEMMDLIWQSGAGAQTRKEQSVG